MKRAIKNPALQSWAALNEAVRGMGEEGCTRLLREERRGRARKKFLQRIHSRLNKARADRERAELVT